MLGRQAGVCDRVIVELDCFRDFDDDEEEEEIPPPKVCSCVTLQNLSRKYEITVFQKQKSNDENRKPVVTSQKGKIEKKAPSTPKTPLQQKQNKTPQVSGQQSVQLCTARMEADHTVV